MTTALATLAAVTVTLLALAYLTATDPKRRRAFKLPPTRRRFAWPVAVLVFAPGVALLAAGQAAAFAIWLGAVTVLGWLIAARAPAPGGSGNGPAEPGMRTSIQAGVASSPSDAEQ